MWDSGASGTSMADTSEGNRCPDIIYAGTALAGSTTYYWRIRFWDDGGEQGTPSATQNFTTGTISTTTQSWGENSSRDDFSAVTEDTFMDSGSTSHEEGTCTGNDAVRIGYRTDAGSRAMRSLIKFDLSGLQSLISSSSQIASATLKVNIAQKNGSDIDVDAFRVLKSWSEGDQCHVNTDLEAGEATWHYQSYSTAWSTGGADSAGTDRAGSADDTTTITGTGWFSWDVTESVKDMFDDDKLRRLGLKIAIRKWRQLVGFLEQRRWHCGKPPLSGNYVSTMIRPAAMLTSGRLPSITTMSSATAVIPWIWSIFRW